MKIIPLCEYPVDEVPLGIVFDPKAGVVSAEKRVRVKKRMSIASKGNLLDKAGGRAIASLYASVGQGAMTPDAFAQQLMPLLPRFENEWMLAVVESIGDGVSPARQTLMKLTPGERDLVLIRHLIEKNPSYNYVVPCDGPGPMPGRCQQNGSQTILRGSFDMRKHLTVRVPDDSDGLTVDPKTGRWVTFQSQPKRGVESLKATVLTCEQQEKSYDGNRSASTYGASIYVMGETVLDLNGRALSEKELAGEDSDVDDVLFGVVDGMLGAPERAYGIDRIVPIACPHCGTKNDHMVQPHLFFLGLSGQPPRDTEQKPSL